MNKRWPGIVGLTLAASIALTGCGSTSTASGTKTTPTSSPTPALPGTAAQRAILDKVIASSQAEVPRMKSIFSKVYSDITFTASYPSTLVITYTFLNHVDPAVAKPRIATQAPILSATCKTDFFPPMEKAGVVKPAARLVFLNPDGSTVASYFCQS